MFCHNCGHQIEDGSQFCNSCGAKQIIKTSDSSNTDTAKEWFCIIKGDKKGPYSKKQIEELIDFDHVDAYTQVCKLGMDEFTPLFKTELVEFFEEEKVEEGGKLDNKWFWLLAIIPHTVNVLISIIAGVFSTNLTILNVVCVIALNCLFIALDTKALKKAGYENRSWFWIGLILVPVYLFIRAAKTTKNLAPPIIWCVIQITILLISSALSCNPSSLKSANTQKTTSMEEVIASCCWQIFKADLKYPYTASVVEYGEIEYDSYGRIICKLVYNAQNGVGNYITDDVYVCLQSCTADGHFTYRPGFFYGEDKVLLKTLNGWDTPPSTSEVSQSLNKLDKFRDTAFLSILQM